MPSQINPLPIYAIVFLSIILVGIVENVPL